MLVVAVLSSGFNPWYILWRLPFLALAPASSSAPWLGLFVVVAAASTSVGGGDALPNLGLQPLRLAGVLTLTCALFLVFRARRKGELGWLLPGPFRQGR